MLAVDNRFEVRIRCSSPTFEASPYDTTDSQYCTFGERHVQILEVGGDRTAPNPKYVLHLVWELFFTLPMASAINAPSKSPKHFTSQPFNDRLGAYTISIRAPFSHSDFEIDIALLQIRLHPHTPTGSLKFSTSLRTKLVASFRMFSVLAALATHRFILFFTLPSILHKAAVLHYRHCLNVYNGRSASLSTGLPLRSLLTTRERWRDIGRRQPTILSLTSRYRQRFPGWGRLEAWGVCQLNPSCLTF
jgi:Protein of unknown function (DUF1365)